MGRLAAEVYDLLAVNPLSEVIPTWELLFEMAGITRPHVKRQVYQLVCQRLRIEQEHRQVDETKGDRTITNP